MISRRAGLEVSDFGVGHPSFPVCLASERMFVYARTACSSRSTPQTGSWSSSRRGAGRSRRRRQRGSLFALASAPTALARSLLDDVVAGDARLAWRGGAVGLAAPPGRDVQLEDAHFVVVDLETTGLTPRTSRICEIGAQRIRALELEDVFETLVDPRVPLPAAVAALTGIRQAELRGAPRAELAIRRFLEFAGDGALVAHNARFDLAFLDREVELLTGRRIAAPVVDTVWLAKRLLGERTKRFGLATLAHFFGVSTAPCHRALPDAQATAEILVRLLGLAQERGARTLADLVELAAPRARRLHVKRSLVAGAPPRPGVYVFRGRDELPLYVGRARDLRGRLRSYFAGGRQRPAVEAALGALERVDWSETGSELEAALDELRLLRELRPPANARGTRPDRHVYLRLRGERWVVTAEVTPFGPLSSRALARRAAQALAGHTGDPAAALEPLRAPRAATRARPALRGRCAPPRPDGGARAGRRHAAGARAATCAACMRRRPRAETGLRQGARARGR